MAMQHRYIKVLQKIKQDHADELSDELKEEIDNLLEARETLPTLEQVNKALSIIAKAIDAIEKVSDWLK